MHGTEISAIVADFWLNFVAMATPFDILKIPIVVVVVVVVYLHDNNQISYRYEHNNKLTPCNSWTPKTLPHLRKKFLNILYRTEICAILVYFRLILVAMATPLAPSKIQIAYLNSRTR